MNSKFYFFLAFSLFSTLILAQQAPFEPSELRVNYCTNSISIDDAKPRFSWVVNDADKGDFQTAYEIIVSSTESGINSNSGDMWSSGKISSKKQNGIFYAGTALLGLKKYWWKVKTYDKNGTAGTWSSADWFETAMINESYWKASYIKGNYKLFRKEFSLTPGKTISKARAYVNGQGWFEFRINGKKVGDHVLDPMTTNNPKRNLYVVYDVTSLLNVETGNAAGLMLGTALRYREDIKIALCQIEVWYSDGTTQTIASDNSWKGLLGGPITHSHVFDGERYDARKELSGWDLPGFNDAGWTNLASSTPGVSTGWSIDGGVLDMNGGEESIIKSGPVWTNYTFEADVKIVSTCVGLVFRATDQNNLYMWQLNPGNPGNPGNIRPHVRVNGGYNVLAQQNLGIAINTNTWYRVKIVVNNNNIKTYVDDQLVSDINDNTHSSGLIGFRESTSSSEKAQADNIVVTSDATTLFQEDFSNGFGQWGSGIGQVLKSQLEPIRIKEVITPISVNQPKAGVFVFDMGKNISGWAELTVIGAAGTVVTLKFSERIYSSGMINRTSTLTGLPAEATDTYTLKGSGTEVWEPRLTYHGFRYVEVSGFPGTPTINNIRGKMFHSDVTTKEIQFNCSDNTINKIFEAYKITQLDNLMGYPTDCNQRGERAGWLADAMVTSESAMLYFDATRLYEKYVKDLLVDEKGNGASGCLIPGGGEDDIIWGAASVSIPWDLYMSNGDSSVLVNTFERAKRYVNWIDNLDVNNNYIFEKATEGIGASGGYVSWNDWCTPDNTPDSKPSDNYMATVYFYRCAKIVSDMAKVLNKTTDYNTYNTLVNNIKNAINTTFLKSNSYYDNNKQAANALALAFGIVPDAYKSAVTQSLVTDIVAKGNHLSTGCAGTYALMPALTENGKSDVALALATQTTYPSWGYMLNVPDACGTIWENWKNVDQSKNHPFLGGSVSSWMIYQVAGIKPTSAGYNTIQLKPTVTQHLFNASATVPSIKGDIVSSWAKSGDRINWQVQVPVNVTGKIYFPIGTTGVVTEKDIQIWNNGVNTNKDGLTYSHSETGFVVFNIGSGSYDFVFNNDSQDCTVQGTNNGNGLNVAFYNTNNFTGSVVYQQAGVQINTNWASSSPNTVVNSDNFSAIYEGTLEAPYTGLYTFYGNADDGEKLTINNQVIFNDNIKNVEDKGTILLTGGTHYDLKYEYVEMTNLANVKLEWRSGCHDREMVPLTRLYSQPLVSTNELLRNRLVIYPNPATKELFIQQMETSKYAKNSIIKVINLQGKTVIIEQPKFTNNPIKINLDKIESGIYIIEIESEGNLIRSKFNKL